MLAGLLSLLIEIMLCLLSGINIISSFLVSPHVPLGILRFPVNFNVRISFYKVNISFTKKSQRNKNTDILDVPQCKI